MQSKNENVGIVFYIILSVFFVLLSVVFYYVNNIRHDQERELAGPNYEYDEVAEKIKKTNELNDKGIVVSSRSRGLKPGEYANEVEREIYDYYSLRTKILGDYGSFNIYSDQGEHVATAYTLLAEVIGPDGNRVDAMRFIYYVDLIGDEENLTDNMINRYFDAIKRSTAFAGFGGYEDARKQGFSLDEIQQFLLDYPDATLTPVQITGLQKEHLNNIPYYKNTLEFVENYFPDFSKYREYLSDGNLNIKVLEPIYIFEMVPNSLK